MAERGGDMKQAIGWAIIIITMTLCVAGIYAGSGFKGLLAIAGAFAIAAPILALSFYLIESGG
jgi:hypothetical protein